MWILIIMAHAGLMSHNDSVALTNIPGFKTSQACAAAGLDSKAVADGTYLKITFACVEQ